MFRSLFLPMLAVSISSCLFFAVDANQIPPSSQTLKKEVKSFAQLHDVCKYESVAAIETVIKNNMAIAINLFFQRDNAGCIPLHYILWRTTLTASEKKQVVDLFIKYSGSRDYDLITMTDNARLTLWYQAVRLGDLEIIKTFLAVAARYNKQWDLISRREDASGWPPLHWAVVLKLKNVVEHLLSVAGARAGQLVRITDYAGQTALDWSRLEGDRDGIRAALENALKKSVHSCQRVTGNTEPLGKDSKNWTELHHACSQNNFTGAQALLQRADHKARDLVFARDTAGQTPLCYAITTHDKYRLVDLLITYAGSYAYELITAKDNTNLSVWHYVICMGDLLLVKQFVAIADQRNAVWDLIARPEGNSGWTPLHWAVILKNKNLVEYLLNLAGKNASKLVCAPDKVGQTPLDWNLVYNNAPEIKKMLEAFLPRATQAPVEAIYGACQSGNVDAVEEILHKAGKKAIDLIFARDSNGYSPLRYALWQKSARRIVEFFIWYAGDHAYDLVTLKDRYNLSLWFHAVTTCDVPVLELFLEVAAQRDDVWNFISKKEGSTGWTPLHHAAVYNKKSVAQYLLKMAGNRASELILQSGHAQETPLDWAKIQKNHEIVAMFEEYLKG